MRIQKIMWYDIVCPHCGSKITLSADEYDKYKKETEGYGSSTILCTEYDEDNKSYEIVYTNFDCPVCKGYIPMTISEGDSCDSDRFGFRYSKNITPFYFQEKELSIDDYIKNFFGGDEVEENE